MNTKPSPPRYRFIRKQCPALYCHSLRGMSKKLIKFVRRVDFHLRTRQRLKNFLREICFDYSTYIPPRNRLHFNRRDASTKLKAYGYFYLLYFVFLTLQEPSPPPPKRFIFFRCFLAKQFSYYFYWKILQIILCVQLATKTIYTHKQCVQKKKKNIITFVASLEI